MVLCKLCGRIMTLEETDYPYSYYSCSCGGRTRLKIISRGNRKGVEDEENIAEDEAKAWRNYHENNKK